jgi:inosine-uridine nucleoside N-ribohydrolase
MSDFTVFDVDFPAAAKQRVIVNTDAKNEADDQYAIVHAVLTPSFDLHGIIPAHYGTRKTATSMQESHDETVKLLRLMGLEGDVHVADGASGAIADESTPVDSPGAQLIIAEAMQDDPRPLYIAFYGPLTDMASALLLEPRIAERNVRVIWIGGGQWRIQSLERYPRRQCGDEVAGRAVAGAAEHLPHDERRLRRTDREGLPPGRDR